MYFTEEAIKELEEAYDAVAAKHHTLIFHFVLRKYKQARSDEFAIQGFVRRIDSMVRCITNVFALLPPDRDSIPARAILQDAEINIQAFLFNAFAATDNLAWIWVNEREISKPNGKELSKTDVGLNKRHIRKTFSENFQLYLKQRENWFMHLEDLRHPLAHRIPLYIPPYMVDPKNEQQYQVLENAMYAASMRHDAVEYERLEAEQKQLAFFRPWMTHSPTENAKHIVFHAQLLADFNTIDELAHKFLEELDRQS